MVVKLSYLIILTVVFNFGCINGQNNNVNSETHTPVVMPGALDTEKYLPLIDGKNVGVIVNQTSRIGSTHLVDSLLARGVNIAKIFCPEHGFRGTADAGTLLDDDVDRNTGLPVISLYGRKKKPAPEDLAGLDVLIFDIQDVGIRFYTYLSTLHYILEAGAEQQVPVIVLDRPNPNIRMYDGPVLDTSFSSFVGLHPVPVAYGMTIGEYARMIVGEKWIKASAKCDLTVIPCLNYNRNSLYRLPVKPSPNLPNMQAIYLYPSLCFFEPTVISVGRGTDKAFQQIGHPSFNWFSYSFKPQSMVGAQNPKHKDVQCMGLNLSAVEPELTRLNLKWLLDFYSYCVDNGLEFFTNKAFFDKLAGTDKLRHALESGLTEDEIRASWVEGLESFNRLRRQYFIYTP